MINTTRIKDIREDFDITQQDMANILGVKRSAYSMWEVGLSVMSLDKLCLFADYFEYSIDYILGLSVNRDEVSLKGFSYEMLGKNIKRLRIEAGISQCTLASKMNVTQACIVRYEKALIKISIANLYLLSKIFDVSMNELCGKRKKIKVKTTN